MNDVRARAERFVGSPVLLGDIATEQLDTLFPRLEPGAIPATVLHNAPGSCRPIATAIAELFLGARNTLDVVKALHGGERFSAPAEAVSTRGSAPEGIGPRIEAAAFAPLSSLL